MNGSNPIDDDVLEAAINNASTFATKMEQSLSANNTTDAINHANEMLENLRSTELSPKSYYKLYLFATDKLRILEAYFIDQHNANEILPDLYMIVQYYPNIVPRLYLMITVGAYLIKCGLRSRREVTRDLVEMCLGVQSPVRGLFLRSFLLQAVLLFDVEACMSTDITVKDIIDFLLINFAEMNKLWVRMQHQGHSRDRERREQDRQDLRLLVGMNLTRLSQLETLDVMCYRNNILLPICDHLIQCGDLIAQQYLMDIIIELFSAEFHLSTLDQLLLVCGKLHPRVNIQPIICNLIDRLSVYVAKEQAGGRQIWFPSVLNSLTSLDTSSATSSDSDGVETPDDISPDSTSNSSLNLKLFNIFFAEIRKLLTQRGNAINKKRTASEESVLQTAASQQHNGLLTEDVPPIMASLTRMALLLCQDRSVLLVNKCLVTTAKYLKALGVVQADPKSRLSGELSRLLCLPMEPPDKSSSSAAVYRNPTAGDPPSLDLRTVIGMSGFRRVASLLEVTTDKCTLAYKVLNLVLGQSCRHATSTSPHRLSPRCRLLDENDLGNFFELISCILQPVSGAGEFPAHWEPCVESHSLITAMIHLLGPEERSADPDLCCRLLHKTCLKLAQAGPPYVRLHFPAIVFEVLQLLKTIQTGQTSDGDAGWHPMIELIKHCIDSLVDAKASELALRLCLKAAVVIDSLPSIERCGVVVYHFISQALTLHEEGVEKSRLQVNTLSLVINSLYRVVNLDQDSRLGLCSQCLRAAKQLLLKHDQSRSVAMVAHLYWPLSPLARRHICNRLPSSDGGAASATPSVDNEAVASSSLAQLRDGNAVMICLKKALGLVYNCMDVTAQAQVLLDLLDDAVGLRLNGCTQVTESFINDLGTSVRELLAKLDRSNLRNIIATKMNNTLEFIKFNRLPKVNADGAAVEGEYEIDQVSDFFAAINIAPIPVMPQPAP